MSGGDERQEPELDPAFRETLLWRFSPQEQRTLRHLGHLLVDMANESGRWGAPEKESIVVEELRAAAADLDLVVTELRRIAGTPGWSGLGSNEIALCRVAAELAEQLAPIASAVRSTVET